MDTMIQMIINMIKNTPNDQELGKKIRAFLAPVMSEQNNNDKKILKG